MKYVTISIDVSWGIERYLIPIKEIKCIKCDYGHSYFTINYLDKEISGYLDSKLHSIDSIMKDIEFNRSVHIALRGDYFEQDEDELESDFY